VPNQTPNQTPTKTPNKTRWYILAAALAVLVALGICILALFFPEAPDPHPRQSLVRLLTVKSAPLRLQARLERNRLEDESPDPLQVAVLNDSDLPLKGLHLALSAPGFALDQQNLACKDSAGTATVDPLPPHQSCRFDIDLSPAARSGTYGITAYLDWNRVQVADHATLLMGPVTIDRDWGAAKWTRMGRRLVTTLKDLTLPILLVGLGATFASRQSRRDRKRRKQESEQAERQDVHHLLLTRVMELAEQHYLLFVNHARLILNESGKILGKKPDADPEKLFLQVLFLLKRMEVFRLSKGGIFFKDRPGERTVGAAWFLLKTRMYAALGDKETAEALAVVKSDWDYATFKSKFHKLTPAWTNFQNWLAPPENSTAPTGSFWQMLGTVDAFQAVMAFEADLALSKYWYEEDGKVVFLRPEPTVLYLRKSAEPYEKTKTSELEALLRDTYHRTVEIKELP
jgi:hypothetical protein